jgi:hypothetical protein
MFSLADKFLHSMKFARAEQIIAVSDAEEVVTRFSGLSKLTFLRTISST